MCNLPDSELCFECQAGGKRVDSALLHPYPLETILSILDAMPPPKHRIAKWYFDEFTRQETCDSKCPACAVLADRAALRKKIEAHRWGEAPFDVGKTVITDEDERD